MGTFSTYLELGLAVVVGVLLKSLLDAILTPIQAIACGANAPTVAIEEGARNCTYLGDVGQWFLALVLAGMLVLALSRGIIAGRVGV